MSKARSTFRKNDIKRLIEAAATAGVKVGAVEATKDGVMRLVPDDGKMKEPSLEPTGEIKL